MSILLLALCFAPGPCLLEPHGTLAWDLPPGGCDYTVVCTPEGGCLPESFTGRMCDPADPLNCRDILPIYAVPQKYLDYAQIIEVFCCVSAGCGEPVVIAIDPWPAYCVDEYETCCSGGRCG